MRSLLLAFALTSSVVTPALAGPHPVEAPAKKPAPKAEDTFPIPKDAEAGEAPGGGGGKMMVYKVPRGRAAVVAEVRESLKTGGWTISKDTQSPSGNAIRLEITKNAKLYKCSFTGDDTRTAIILTLP